MDGVVSDIGFPDGSGLDVMRHVRAHQNIKGIALSGFGQDDDVKRCRDDGPSSTSLSPLTSRSSEK